MYLFTTQLWRLYGRPVMQDAARMKATLLLPVFEEDIPVTWAEARVMVWAYEGLAPMALQKISKPKQC